MESFVGTSIILLLTELKFELYEMAEYLLKSMFFVEDEILEV